MKEACGFESSLEFFVLGMACVCISVEKSEHTARSSLEMGSARPGHGWPFQEHENYCDGGYCAASCLSIFAETRQHLWCLFHLYSKGFTARPHASVAAFGVAQCL